MLQGFPLVVAPHMPTMILGSFPGEASLDAAQYDAHRRRHSIAGAFRSAADIEGIRAL